MPALLRHSHPFKSNKLAAMSTSMSSLSSSSASESSFASCSQPRSARSRYSVESSSTQATSTLLSADHQQYPEHVRASTSAASTQEAMPAFKARTVHLPLQLPASPRPLVDVDCTTLVVDEELSDVPIGYVLAQMRAIGAVLLNAATHVSIEIPNTSQLPSYLWATSDSRRIASELAPSSSRTPACLPSPPTHILAVRAPDVKRVLLVPVHGLLFASRSPSLSILSSSPHVQPGYPNHPALPSSLPPMNAEDNSDRIALPVVELKLPSATAFPLLLTFIYTQNSNLLLSSLLPKPMGGSSKAFSSPATATELAEALRSCSEKLLLHQVSLVHALWQDVVALSINDELLWASMRFAWAVLVGAMAFQRRDETLERVDQEVQ
ncbi:BQ2448_6921 [Microbotryum intermedium]|uniref:BQ2448_6921 protein n=1 Tax=Microbotryum intermedium TaxID=269621 RepID=A0A238FPH5_9BASI|nr:BQ2448_6921 [Microbotryum intermedium]